MTGAAGAGFAAVGAVAGIVAVVLAMPDPKSTVYAIAVGLVLYFLIERKNLFGRKPAEETSEDLPAEVAEEAA